MKASWWDGFAAIGKMKSGRGVIGGVGTVVIGALLVLGILGVAAAARGGPGLVEIAVLVTVVILAFVLGALIYADRNPEAATLESIHLLKLRQQDTSARDIVNVTNLQLDQHPVRNPMLEVNSDE